VGHDNELGERFCRDELLGGVTKCEHCNLRAGPEITQRPGSPHHPEPTYFVVNLCLQPWHWALFLVVKSTSCIYCQRPLARQGPRKRSVHVHTFPSTHD
jgi:hypothetical protein